MNHYTAQTLEEALNAASMEENVPVESLNYYTKETENGLEVTTWMMDDVKEFIFDYLGNFFMGFDCDAECAIEEKDGGFIVNLNVENNAVLIGKMGKTLAALNMVVRGAVNAEFKKRIDVLVDVNRYKEDRYRKLSGMARRIGKQVQRSHVDVVLDPMPNDERKVIHKTLTTWHNLKTESEGVGPARHICIRYVPDEETVTEDTPVTENTEPVAEEVTVEETVEVTE